MASIRKELTGFRATIKLRDHGLCECGNDDERRGSAKEYVLRVGKTPCVSLGHLIPTARLPVSL